MHPALRSLFPLVLALSVAIGCGGQEGADDAPPAPDMPAASEPAPEAVDGMPQLTPLQEQRLKELADKHRAGVRVGQRGKPMDSGVLRVESVDGQPIQLPADADGLPTFQGPDPMRYVKTPDGGSLTVYETDDDLDAGRDLAVSQLERDGWSITSEQAQGDIMLMTAVKDGRTVNVAILDDGTNTKITLIAE